MDFLFLLCSLELFGAFPAGALFHFLETLLWVWYYTVLLLLRLLQLILPWTLYDFSSPFSLNKSSSQPSFLYIYFQGNLILIPWLKLHVHMDIYICIFIPAPHFRTQDLPFQLLLKSMSILLSSAHLGQGLNFAIVLQNLAQCQAWCLTWSRCGIWWFIGCYGWLGVKYGNDP